jgi:Fibronectin type III domain
MKIINKIIFSIVCFCVTNAAFAQLPTINEGFESATFPPTTPGNWITMDNGVGTAVRWAEITDITRVYAGLKAAVIDRENVGAGNTSIDWLVTPQITVTANNQLRFFTKQTLVGNNGSTYEIRVSTNPSQTNQAAYTTVQSWTETTLNATYNIYEEKTVSLAAYPTGTQLYIAFVRLNTQPSTATTGDRWLVDDVKVVQQCLDPTILSVGTITPTSAVLTWTANGTPLNYDVEVVQGFTTPFTNIATQVGVANNTSYTGLTPGTVYKYQVRANCGLGNYSAWIGPFNFLTKPYGSICSSPITITSLPFSQTSNTNLYGDEVDVIQGVGLCGAVPATTNYQAGFEVFYSYTPTVSGNITITMNPTGVSSSLFVYNGCGNYPGTCIAGEANENDMQREIYFSAIAGQTYIIVISSSSTPAAGIPYNILIQDFPVNCGSPSITISDVTLNSANFTWSNLGVSSYQVAITPVSALFPTSPSVISTTSFQATGLNEGSYFFWIRTNCGGGLFSPWRRLPFETYCITPQILGDYGYNGTNTTLALSFITQNNSPTTTRKEICILPLQAGVSPFSSTPPLFTTSGQPNNYYATGLEPDIIYNAYVRSDCGVNGLSTWSAPHIIGGFSNNTKCLRGDIDINIRKTLFVSLINHLLGIVNSGGTIISGYNPIELQNLATYISDQNPRIYNFSYSNGTLEFSFSNHPNALRRDVQISGYSSSYGSMTNFDISNYYSSQYFMYKIPVVFANNPIVPVTLTLKHISFCDIPCPAMVGGIYSSGIRNGELEIPYTCGDRLRNFSPNYDTTLYPTATIQWNVLSPTGVLLTTSNLANLQYTFTELGNNTVELIITEPNGCKTKFTEIVPVVSCGSCTSSNPRTQIVKNLFKKLINKLITMSTNEVPDGTSNLEELKNLIPYITDLKPEIYNFTNDQNKKISFSFTNHEENELDVQILYNSALVTVTDINLSNYISSETSTEITTTFSDNTEIASENFVRHVNFCPDEFCVNHIAIVVDESGSIDDYEKAKIKRQLRKFILKQKTLNEDNPNWNMYVSLIGMSDTDTNNRTDHVLYKRVSSSTIGLFNEWLDGPATPTTNNINEGRGYGNRYGLVSHRGVSGGSDFWKSGLDKALLSDVPPKLVIMITDGSETAIPFTNLDNLKTTMAKFNNYSQHVGPLDITKPHLYVVGIDNGFYVYDEQSALRQLPRNEDPNYVPSLKSSSPTSRVTPALALSLKYLLQIPTPDFPINTVNTVNHASSAPDFKTDDYIGYTNFEIFGDPDSSFLSDNMDDVYVSCGSTEDKDPCDDCFSFQPKPGEVYVLNAWVKEELNIQVKNYTSPKIILRFLDFNREAINKPLPITDSEVFFKPIGDIIDGWQRIGGKFTIPKQSTNNPTRQTVYMDFELVNESNSNPVFFDDIRIYPVKGSMKSFVYDPETFKLMSELDENNYATFYEYDNEGGLVRIKKETVKGIKTIQETRSGNFIKVE